jgi:hypothetical protein
VHVRAMRGGDSSWRGMTNWNGGVWMIMCKGTAELAD